MQRTIRVFWPNSAGGWFNFNWDGVITAESVVHVSACECSSIEPGQDPNTVSRIRGEESVWVNNVRPHGPNPGAGGTGGVEFVLALRGVVTSINIATDITVFDPPEARIIA